MVDQLGIQAKDLQPGQWMPVSSVSVEELSLELIGILERTGQEAKFVNLYRTPSDLDSISQLLPTVVNRVVSTGIGGPVKDVLLMSKTNPEWRVFYQGLVAIFDFYRKNHYSDQAIITKD